MPARESSLIQPCVQQEPAIITASFRCQADDINGSDGSRLGSVAPSLWWTHGILHRSALWMPTAACFCHSFGAIVADIPAWWYSPATFNTSA